MMQQFAKAHFNKQFNHPATMNDRRDAATPRYTYKGRYDLKTLTHAKSAEVDYEQIRSGYIQRLKS